MVFCMYRNACNLPLLLSISIASRLSLIYNAAVNIIDLKFA